MKPQTKLERLIAGIQRRGALVDEPAGPADKLRMTLPYPRLFADLLTRHFFIPFEAGGVLVCSNLRSQEDNLADLLADSIFTRSLVEDGFLPFGRPATGSYDRVCFDIRGTMNPLDASVVLMDHEAILSHNHIPKPTRLADGILQLVTDPAASPMAARLRAPAGRRSVAGRHR